VILMIDYHMHLENGPYTLEWLQQFWQKAQERGITEIGISEHCHKFKEFYPVFAPIIQAEHSYEYMRSWIAKDFQQSLDAYIELLLQARQQGIPVKIGLELDYIPHSHDYVRSLIQKYPFDYIIGSVHIIENWGFDYAVDVWENVDVEQAYIDYFNTLLTAVNELECDIIGHFDVIKVFGHRSQNDLTLVVDQILQLMAKKQMCLELNSAGWRKPVGEAYPAEWILQRAAEYQVPITFASDAHYPEHVGYHWERLVSLAKRCGYREYSIFSQRQRFVERIPK